MRDPPDIIGSRHSERTAFDPSRPVSPEDLHRILNATRWAPTAHNMQNYEVIVIDDPERLEEIGRIRSAVSDAFVRENYAQLSFSEEELRAKKTGLLASIFPPSWLTPDPDPARITDPEHALLGDASQSARCSWRWSTTRPGGHPPLGGRSRVHEPGVRHGEHVAHGRVPGNRHADPEHDDLDDFVHRNSYTVAGLDLDGKS